jgi:hypothetical protein
MARRRGCKYGKLKHKVGGRRCKLPPSHRGKRSAAGRSRSRREAIKYERDLEREAIARHKAMGYHRRRRRR